MQIAQELISEKLAGREKLAREKLRDLTAADTIARLRTTLVNAETVSDIRFVESQAAAAYWSAWRNVPIKFPRNDLLRVPEHWRTFEAATLHCLDRLDWQPILRTLCSIIYMLCFNPNLALPQLRSDSIRDWVYCT